MAALHPDQRASKRAARKAPWLVLLFFLALVPLVPTPATAWDVDPDAPAPALEDFHAAFAGVAFYAPRHGAGGLGLTGFEVFAEVAGSPDVEGEGRLREALDGGLPANALAIARVGVRKGLPGKVDVGVAYAEVLDAGIGLLSADLKWSLIDGGVLKPALAVRFSGTESLDSDGFDFRQYAVDLTLSKGFANVTPYVGAAVARSESTFDRTLGGRFDVDTTEEILYAGLRINLLLPKITVGVEQGEHLQGVVRVSLGF